jgi:hypothetical protein
MPIQPSNARRHRGRVRLSLLALIVPILILIPGTATTQAAGSELTVMTRNLSFGTDLSPILAATSQFEFVTAVSAAYAQAQATDFPGRAKAWADEIDHARPDLIGLQAYGRIAGAYDLPLAQLQYAGVMLRPAEDCLQWALP